MPELYDPATGGWSPAQIDGVRAGAAGVRLEDGRILIVGGRDGSMALRSAIIFDPARYAFAAVAAPMAQPRVRPTVLTLIDGRVLIAGGADGSGPDRSAEVFDPVPGTFTPVGSLSTTRLGTATLLPDGRVLFAGGETPDGAAARDVELLDPALSEFSAAPPMLTARRGHQATLLPDGRVLITGGFGLDGGPVADAELFSPADGTFGDAGAMRSARADHRALLLATGDVLIVAGRGADGALASGELYRPSTGEFIDATLLHEPRSAAAAVALAEGRVLVAGGRGAAAGPLATAEILTTQTPSERVHTSTTLAASAGSSTFGDPVTYRAIVRSVKGSPDGVVQFVDAGTRVLATAALVNGVAGVTVSDILPGPHAITAVYGGSAPFEGSQSPVVRHDVGHAQARATLTVSPLQRQYSDRIAVEATVFPPNAAETVTFKIGTQVLGTYPVVGGRSQAVLPLVGTTGIGARIVIAAFNQARPSYEIYNPARSISVLREDARVSFTAPTTVNTQCGSCSTAVVRLEATVRDISLAGPGTDQDPGDVGTSTVSFVNRATGAVIQTVAVAADPKDSRVGKAVYDWRVDIGKTASRTFTIGMAVGNQYVRNSAVDDVKVKVVRK